ncbi:MAG: DNA repair protein RadC [Oscillospiraceae bacterium]|nr:DNA repair protein RadC [Oscillospiraceae bacterium]
MDKPKPKPTHLHHGHRQRKREQYLKSGIEHLPEHEPLEFLLYYAIPRGDTNATAHLLIKEFGSLAGVMNADYNELMKVDGVGQNAAALICFTRMFSKLYVKKQAQEELETLFNSDRLKEFCSALFVGSVEEEFHCLYLTDDLKLIAHEKICDGKLGDVKIPLRKITRSIIEKNCSRLVITHNHPAGSCIPSRADVDSTISIRDIYIRMEVELIDHIVVGRDGITSMREAGFMEFR